MDLHAPLGRKTPPPRRPLMPIALAALAAAAFTGFGVYLLEADPHGGEPYAVASIPPEPAPRPAPTPAPAPVRPSPDPMPTGSIAAPSNRPPDTTTFENGVRVVSPGGPVAVPRTGPLIIDVTKALDEAPRKSAQEKGGSVAALPKVTTGAPPGAARPRVAILVGGLGLSEIATRTAIETMPAAIDLAFVPTGATLASSVQAAQAKGHEILLQLPMQSPQGTSPAPHALSANEPPAALNADLDWLTSRISGYAGVTNLLGASVTSDATAMTAVLRAIGRRGAFYVDDGTSRRSVATSLAARLDVPAVKADVVLDATADPAAVRANLERLAAIARAKGAAIGTATALSDHIAAIARFATELDARGIDLVPVGAIARRGSNVAATR